VELRSARGELMWKSLLPVPSGMLDNGDSARWVSPSATWTPPYLLVLFADQRGATRIINRVTLGGTLVSQKTIEAPIGFIGSSPSLLQAILLRRLGRQEVVRYGWGSAFK
jgi:hypothetical protein